jgi:glutamate-1-semialdehyde 2,1-aminomutase
MNYSPPAGSDPSLRNAELFPGHYSRPSMNVGRKLPPLLVSGAGARVTDVNAHSVLDLNNNFTANIHGHCHSTLDKVAAAILSKGVSFGLPTEHEYAHAQRLIARINGAERVKYATSGSEAVMNALRLARAWTGKNRIIAVKGAFHGTSDLMLLGQGDKGPRGVPESVRQDLVLVPPNDLAALNAAFDVHGQDLAAIIIDPMPNYAGLVPLTQDFVTCARERSAALGACLICDEVVNFRQAVGGMEQLLGIVPDLTVVGKLVGGGYPVGAVLGRAEIMSLLDPFEDRGIIHGGTFAASPLAMAVGAAALDLFDDAAIVRLNTLGDQLRSGLQAELGNLGWQVRGQGSLARLLPPPGSSVTSAAYWWKCYENGVLTTPSGLMALSTPMTTEDIGFAVERLALSAKAFV